ncbi:hypothetical protein [Burkholderia cepacia]|uniref:hypothetical protein n=1 Tax=Burkholderia cepacia TaxID=292 RepID=UPI002AB5F6AB|nr:hypothetical protein [Burkholderia cepacia]
MKSRALSIVSGAILLLLILPAVASAQSLARPTSNFQDVADVLMGYMPWMFAVSIILFGVVQIGGEDLLITLLAIIFFPITIIVFLVGLVAKRGEMLEEKAKRQALADSEAATRGEFDDWLTEAILSAEIAACANPTDAVTLDQLDRLKTARRQNGARLVELHDQFDTAEVKEGVAQTVKDQWAALQQA